jgi:hypothetical protein
MRGARPAPVMRVPDTGFYTRAVIRSIAVGAFAFGPLRDVRPQCLLAALALAGASLTSCDKAVGPLPQAQSSGAVVARVGAVPITAAQVAAQIARAPGLTATQALDQWITFELLAQAAAGAGTAVSPDDVVERKKVEVQRLVERDIEPRLLPDSIPDADVSALYQRGKHRFVHGRMVRTTVLCVFTGARMNAARRAHAEANAKLLAAELETHPARTSAEAEALATQPRWVERQVSVTTVWQDQEAGEPFPPVVGRALASLHRPGERTPLVGDETGYYIAWYVAEEPPLNQSFEEVAPTLRAEMYEPWRRQRFLRLTMDLAAGHDIEVFPDNLRLTER